LVDRTSLEIFGHRGELSMSICYLPEAADNPLVFYAEDGAAHIVSLAVHQLRSAWK
jgi:sucrose-6-phosphate hydrolase SacC (GH32 family)